MRIRAKWLLIGALPLCALAVGATDRAPERLADADSLFSTCMAVFCIALVFCWYRLDAEERAYRRTWGLGIAMVLVTVVALPWYMIRSRPGWHGLLTLTKAAGVFIFCGLAYRLASTLSLGA